MNATYIFSFNSEDVMDVILAMNGSGRESQVGYTIRCDEMYSVVITDIAEKHSQSSKRAPSIGIGPFISRAVDEK